MSLVISNSSEVILLRYILNHTAPTDVVLHLYSNNVTPTESDTISTYTESVAAGYSSVELTGTDWTVSSVAGLATATFATQTFTFSGAATIYGYYVTDNSSTTLLWAERFTAAPVTIPLSGGSILVTPEITLE